MSYKENSERLQETVNAIFGEQTALSYPLPDVVSGGLFVEHHFIYPVGTSLMSGRPFARVTIDMKTGLLLNYKDCRLEDFMDTEEHPLSEVINYELPKKTSIKTFKATQSLIGKLYEVIRDFAFKEPLTPEEKIILGKYVVLLLTSVPESLVPYYKKTGKSFFSWAYNNI